MDCSQRCCEVVLNGLGSTGCPIPIPQPWESPEPRTGAERVCRIICTHCLYVHVCLLGGAASLKTVFCRFFTHFSVLLPPRKLYSVHTRRLTRRHPMELQNGCTHGLLPKLTCKDWLGNSCWFHRSGRGRSLHSWRSISLCAFCHELNQTASFLLALCYAAWHKVIALTQHKW